MLADGWYGLTAKNLKLEHSSSGLPPTTDIARFPKVVRRAAYPDDRDIRKLRPTRRSVNRGRSRILRFQSVVGSGVIAAQRTNSAHLHRPWRANLHLQQELRSHLSEMAASEIPRWTSLENPTVLQAPNSNRE